MEKLTVVILTYNLENYVQEAVESVLMQEVDFEYKIRISDDCSSDNTIEIIKDLQKQHPDKIEILLSAENGGCLKNSNRAFDGIKSQYISLLDGDDFWIGKNSLQKEIDFLDNHSDYTICSGDTTQLYSDGSQKRIINAVSDSSYDFHDYIYGRVPYIVACGTIFRNCIYNNGIPQIYYDVENTFENCAVRGDEFRFITHLEQGKLMLFAETTACYRIHAKGIWQSASETKRIIETAISKNFYDKYYHDLQEDTFRIMCVSSYRNLIRHLLEQKIYDKFFLTEEETYLLTEYLKDISKRNISWTACEVKYIRKLNISIIKKIWRMIRKRFLQ